MQSYKSVKTLLPNNYISLATDNKSGITVNTRLAALYILAY